MRERRERRYGKEGNGIEIHNIKEYTNAGLKRALRRIFNRLNKEEIMEFVETYWDGTSSFSMSMGDNANYLYIVDFTEDHLYIYIWESDNWTDPGNHNDFFKYRNY